MKILSSLMSWLHGKLWWGLVAEGREQWEMMKVAYVEMMGKYEPEQTTKMRDSQCTSLKLRERVGVCKENPDHL